MTNRASSTSRSACRMPAPLSRRSGPGPGLASPSTTTWNPNTRAAYRASGRGVVSRDATTMTTSDTDRARAGRRRRSSASTPSSTRRTPRCGPAAASTERDHQRVRCAGRPGTRDPRTRRSSGFPRAGRRRRSAVPSRLGGPSTRRAPSTRARRTIRACSRAPAARCSGGHDELGASDRVPPRSRRASRGSPGRTRPPRSRSRRSAPPVTRVDEVRFVLFDTNAMAAFERALG